MTHTDLPPTKDAVACAGRIAASLGIDPESAAVLPGGHETHVVRVQSAHDDVVVRLARDPEGAGGRFDVEAWCLRAVARAGLRTSPLVQRGELHGVEYLVAGPSQPPA